MNSLYFHLLGGEFNKQIKLYCSPKLWSLWVLTTNVLPWCTAGIVKLPWGEHDVSFVGQIWAHFFYFYFMQQSEEDLCLFFNGILKFSKQIISKMIAFYITDENWLLHLGEKKNEGLRSPVVPIHIMWCSSGWQPQTTVWASAGHVFMSLITAVSFFSDCLSDSLVCCVGFSSWVP